MTIHLRRGSTKFTQKDFEPLEQHYEKKPCKRIIHGDIKVGIVSIEKPSDYLKTIFVVDRDAFGAPVAAWSHRRKSDARRQARSWKRIVEVLDNPIQQKIVSDDRERTSTFWSLPVQGLARHACWFTGSRISFSQARGPQWNLGSEL